MANMEVLKHPLILSIFLTLFFLFVGVLFSLFVRSFLLRTLKGKENLFYRIYRGLRPALVLWFLILGIYFSLRFFGENLGHETNKILQNLSTIVLFSSISYTFGAILEMVVEDYFNIRSSIISVSVRLGVFITGLLLGLSAVGFQITPILTALGIGGLAVALALQPLLSNLFSGIYITSSKRVQVGDQISVGNYSGEVIDVGVYSTIIRDPNNNIVYIPNSQIINSILVSYNKPDPTFVDNMRILIYGFNDPERAKEVLLEILEEMENFEGFDKTFKPIVWFDGFGPNALIFTIRFKALSRLDWRNCASEIRLRVYKRFK
jgi:small-conductance mechanosensitive channel